MCISRFNDPLLRCADWSFEFMEYQAHTNFGAAHTSAVAGQLSEDESESWQASAEAKDFAYILQNCPSYQEALDQNSSIVESADIVTTYVSSPMINTRINSAVSGSSHGASTWAKAPPLGIIVSRHGGVIVWADRPPVLVKLVVDIAQMWNAVNTLGLIMENLSCAFETSENHRAQVSGSRRDFLTGNSILAHLSDAKRRTRSVLTGHNTTSEQTAPHMCFSSYSSLNVTCIRPNVSLVLAVRQHDHFTLLGVLLIGAFRVP